MTQPPPALLIEAQAITVRIGRGELLSAVDLSVRAREVVSLIGPNGAGKTTLIRVLLGLLKPTAGRVWRQPGLVVGYVPQRIRMDPILPLTVRRFLPSAPGAGARAPCSPPSAPAIWRRPRCELSGGELQRVVLARALVREPGLLFSTSPYKGSTSTASSSCTR